MSSEHRRPVCNAHHHNSTDHTEQPSDSLFNLTIPHFRRGFDLRRPIMSQPMRDVIDLTEDTSSPPEAHTILPAPVHTQTSTAANRPPRFDRNIINVDEQEDINTVDLREESPEIQFLTSRPRSRSLSTSRRSARRRPALVPVTRSPGRRPHAAIRVTAGDRNPHQVGGWADALHNIQFPRPHHSNFGRALGEELVGIEGDLAAAGRFFQAPDHLNFLQAGFNYEQPSRPQQQPRPPTYDPPPPAQRGFTRSPNEDDFLVCPHCDDELGVGDDEVKRQVWVVRACGHVRIDGSASFPKANLRLRSTAANVRRTDQSDRAHSPRHPDPSSLGRNVLWRIVARMFQIPRLLYRSTCNANTCEYCCPKHFNRQRVAKRRRWC